MSSKKKFRTKAISTLLSTAMTVTALSGALAPAVMATTSSVNMGAVSSVTLAAGDTLNIYDNGGPNGVYSENCNDTLTINAPAGYGINLSGSYHTEATYDLITINGFNSNLVSSTLLNNASGSNSVNIVSYGNTMRISFTSDRNNSMDEGATGYAFTATLFEMHSHSFTYSVDGDTVSATCTDGCTSGWDSSPVTLTIVPPTRTVFNDNGSAAATLTGLDAFNSATGLTLSEDSIKYVGRDETTYTESATAPVNAGKYTAKLTYGDYTISTDYEIAKADPVITVSAKTLFVTGSTLNLLQSFSIDPADGGTIRFSIKDKENQLEDGVQPQAKKVDDYTVYYRAENPDDSNYINQEFTDERSIQVSIVAVPVVTMDGYTYGKTLPVPSVDSFASDATFYYNTENSNEGGIEWKDMTPTTLPVGTYYMYAKIADTESHVATTTAPVAFEVSVAEETPYTIELSKSEYVWDGNECVPEVTVIDKENNVVPPAEYKVEIENNVEPGTATVTITDKDGGNYTVSGEATFTIKKASFTPVVTMDDYTWGSEPSVPALVENTSSGEVTYYYSKTESNENGTEWKDIEAETLDAGTYYMYAVVAETDHYFEAKSAPVAFEIGRKALNLELSIEGWEYDSEAQTPVLGGNLGNAEPVYVYYSDADRQIKTTVADNAATEEGGVPANAGTYYLVVTVPETTNYQEATAYVPFTISKKLPEMGEDKDFDVVPLFSEYQGFEQFQNLVTIYVKENSGLTVKLSFDENFNTLQELPRRYEVGEYPIYYMVEGNDNYESITWSEDNFVVAKITETAPLAENGEPKANDLTYSGEEQTLVTAPVYKENSAGVAKYVLGTDDQTAPEDGWTTTIPTGLNADTYYVWYKIEGGTGYRDEDPTCVVVNIDPKAVTVSGITAKDKTYDGTTDAVLDYTGAAFDGKVESDTLTISATGAFADENVGENKSVAISNLTLGGDSVSNYVLAENGQQATATANISAKDIIVSGITAEDKTYDGNTTATLVYDNAEFDGLLEDDTLTVSGVGSFADKNVGENKTVTISELALGGDSAINYKLAAEGQQETTTAAITAKAITVSGITATDKTYDGKVTATLDYNTVSLAGLVEGDDLSVVATGTYADKNVGTGKTVTISDLILNGEDAGNYVLAEENQQTETTADISAKTVTVTGITVDSREYDGTTNATLNYAAVEYEGMIENDILGVEAVGTYDDQYVGTAKAVTISGLALNGGDKDNYVLAAEGNQVAATGDITQKAIVISANDQVIELNGSIDTSVDSVDAALADGDTISKVTLTSNLPGTDKVATGTINISAVEIVNGEINVTDNYDIEYHAGNVEVTVYKTTISELPEATAITYGQSLGDSAITSGKVTSKNGDVSGTFTWTVAETKPSVSDSDVTEYEVTFTPDDEEYSTATAKITVTVNQADPEYTVPTGLTATYGQTLGDVELPEGWSFADTTVSVGNAGTNTFEATFTPADTTNYNIITEDVKVAVSPIDPEYTVPTGLTADYGQTLADVELPEGWAFAEPTTSVGNAGTNTFKATFTPKDTANYNIVTGIEVTVEVAKINPEYTVPTGLKATYGQTLADVKLPDGWAFADATASVGNAGTNTFKATFTPKDTANYNTISNVDVKVEVSKADATVKTAPTAIALTENGSAQALVNAGTANNGTMQYAIGTDAKTAPTSGYSTTIPTGTAAGTYYVWYKVVGSANYNDSKASCVTVTIAAKPAETGVAGFVERLYTIALGRESDPDGKAYWVDCVNTKGSTGADVARGFLFSPEFIDSNMSDSDFVEVLYKTFFDRASEPEGKAFWLDSLAKGTSKKEVINGFINSPEWQEICKSYGIPSGAAAETESGVVAFATRLYTTCLGREPEAVGLKYWSEELSNKRVTGTSAAYGFFFSQEFKDKNLSNEEYVKSLYRTFMGREFDNEGLTYWVGLLNNNASRESVFYGFAQSAEFGEICASYGILR